MDREKFGRTTISLNTAERARLKRERAGTSQLVAGNTVVERRQDDAYKDTIVTLGEAFKIMRRRCGRKADSFQVSRQTINKWEAGRAWPMTATIALRELGHDHTR